LGLGGDNCSGTAAGFLRGESGGGGSRVLVDATDGAGAGGVVVCDESDLGGGRSGARTPVIIIITRVQLLLRWSRWFTMQVFALYWGYTRPTSRLGRGTPLPNPHLLAPLALRFFAPNVKSWLHPCHVTETD